MTYFSFKHILFGKERKYNSKEYITKSICNFSVWKSFLFLFQVIYSRMFTGLNNMVYHKVSYFPYRFKTFFVSSVFGIIATSRFFNRKFESSISPKLTNVFKLACTFNFSKTMGITYVANAFYGFKCCYVVYYNFLINLSKFTHRSFDRLNKLFLVNCAFSCVCFARQFMLWSLSYALSAKKTLNKIQDKITKQNYNQGIFKPVGQIEFFNEAWFYKANLAFEKMR